MGWDSELTVGGRLFGQWRKYAPSHPALLFKRTDLLLAPAQESEDDQELIVWSTSAADALANLRASGFRWEHLLLDYAQSRELSLQLAFERGRLMVHLGDAGYRELSGRLEAHAPADDLRMLADAIFIESEATSAAQTEDLAECPFPPTPIRDALLFGDSVGSPEPTLDGPVRDERSLILTRALDYFLRSQESAPLVGWAFSLMVLLHHADPAERVEFDISGGFHDGFDGSPLAYGEKFWQSARANLSETARFYGSIFSALASATTDIAQAAHFGRLEALLVGATESGITKAAKGQRLEELVAALLEVPDTRLPILEKRLKHADEELDLVLRNDLEEPFWRNFSSPLILVECKNWSSRVGIDELRILETKMRDRHKLCSVALFVSLNGFSRPFEERVRDLQLHGLTVFPLDGANIREIISNKQTLPQWLCDKGMRRIL